MQTDERSTFRDAEFAKSQLARFFFFTGERKMRIGVGDSLRFLRKKSQVAAELMKSSEYRPNELVSKITHYQALPETNVAGYHLFCFNQVENTEHWRKETIECLK